MPPRNEDLQRQIDELRDILSALNEEQVRHHDFIVRAELLGHYVGRGSGWFFAVLGAAIVAALNFVATRLIP